MPMTKLLQHAAFDAETTAILTSAFDEAWHSVQRSGSDLASPGMAEETRSVLAKHIVELGATGERDRQRLVAGALVYLGTRKLARLSQAC